MASKDKSKESEDNKKGKDSKELKDNKKGKDSKESKDDKKRKDSKESKESIDPKDSKESKDKSMKIGLEILKKRGYESFVLLDSGGQGNVYKTVKNKKTFAAKVVHIEDGDQVLTQDMKRELQIIKKVNHPNCIRVEDIFRTKSKVFIVMDFMPNKSIGDEVDAKGAICEWKTKLYFSQISNAIKYLHKCLIAHRDLKLDNILLDANFNPKVCDFGFSRLVEKDPKTGEIKKSTTFVGTASYEPPEMLRYQSYDPFKSDIWSLGVCLFVMLNYEYPFNSDEPKQKLLEKQTKKEYKFESKIEPKLSNAVKDLVNKLLEPNPNERISIDAVCKHHWIPNIFHDLDLKH